MSILLSLLVPALLTPSALAQDEAAEEAAEEAEEEVAPEEVAVTYTLDAANSLLWVRTFKDTSLTHDHAVHATGWSGEVTWHPSDASQCKVEVTVPVSGLVVDEPSIRQVAGITAEAPDEGDRATIKETMLGDDQLDGARFPRISFTSTSCSGTSGQVDVTGNLTIHGVTRPVTAAMKVSADGSALSATGGFSVNHSDFGIEPFSFLLGAFANGEQLQFGINVKGAAE